MSALLSTLDVLVKSLKICFPLKRQTKIAADDTLFFYFYLSREIRLDVHVNPLPSRMKYQVLFSLKNNENVFINVICCSRDCHFKG